jgi:hypothetical protein
MLNISKSALQGKGTSAPKDHVTLTLGPGRYRLGIVNLGEGRTVKAKVTRKGGQGQRLTCTQHRFHSSHMTPVNALGGDLNMDIRVR